MLGSRWVGFDNFTRFFTNPRSLQIFWNTLRFALFAVTFNVSIGLLLAVALNRAMPGWLLYFFRLAFFLPVIIAAAFVSIVWGYFFADDLGVINYFLRAGRPAQRALADRQPQRHDVDHHHGRLEEHRLLHGDLHRRAAGRAEEHHRGGADGRDAGLAQLPAHHPPYISPVVFFAIVYASIGALQVYELIVILTQGGPGDATRSLSILIVEEGFGSFQIGYAAAISVVMTVIILIITAIQQLLSRRWVQQ